MSNPVLLKDNMQYVNDKIIDKPGTVKCKHPSPYTRTRVIGVDQFGDTLFDEENQVVLGGALFTLEKVFGIQADYVVDYINNIKGIATSGPAITESYPPKNNVVCLFGVGTGGCGESVKSVKDVKFYEREIFEMVPFRVTDQPIKVEERDKYWFRNLRQDGKTEYFLKRFERTPFVEVRWKDAVEEGEDGTLVEPGVHDTTRTEPIETYVELHLKILSKDVKEYFELNGDIDSTRINSIGLFTGILSDVGNNETDYKQVKMFSKLNIPNEALVLNKDIDIYYRIYTS